MTMTEKGGRGCIAYRVTCTHHDQRQTCFAGDEMRLLDWILSSRCRQDSMPWPDQSRRRIQRPATKERSTGAPP